MLKARPKPMLTDEQQRLAEEWYPYALKIAKKKYMVLAGEYGHTIFEGAENMTLQDCESEAGMVLVEAVRQYNPDLKIASFKTYLISAVNRRIWDVYLNGRTDTGFRSLKKTNKGCYFSCFEEIENSGKGSQFYREMDYLRRDDWTSDTEEWVEVMRFIETLDKIDKLIVCVRLVDQNSDLSDITKMIVGYGIRKSFTKEACGHRLRCIAEKYRQFAVVSGKILPKQIEMKKQRYIAEKRQFIADRLRQRELSATGG